MSTIAYKLIHLVIDIINLKNNNFNGYLVMTSLQDL